MALQNIAVILWDVTTLDTLDTVDTVDEAALMCNVQ